MAGWEVLKSSLASEALELCYHSRHALNVAMLCTVQGVASELTINESMKNNEWNRLYSPHESWPMMNPWSTNKKLLTNQQFF